MPTRGDAFLMGFLQLLRNQGGFRRRGALAGISLSLTLLGSSLEARAQVTEPNGTRVPTAMTTGGEPTLQSFFTTEMETIDAVAEASPEPGVYSPLCNFTAKLVLSASQAEAGLAWYNVPATP